MSKFALLPLCKARNNVFIAEIRGRCIPLINLTTLGKERNAKRG